jgi:5'-nucleotidase
LEDAGVIQTTVRKVVFGVALLLSAGANAYELNVAHINDHHSNMRPFASTLTIDGQPIRVSLGGFARLATAINELEQTTPNLLKIHAGDAITGTPYYKFFKGESDAQVMNKVCFDAFVIGNHEFDSYDAGLKTFLDFLRESPNCDTSILSANVHPASGTPLAIAPDGKPYFLPYVVKEVGGVPIGIVGITVVGKTQNASRPLASTEFEEEVKAAQRSIDELRQQGVNHIVLVTHVGFDADLGMASRLSGVDAIVGGDSHTLVGDFSEVGLVGRSSYPTVVRNKDGGMVCVVQAWEYSKVVGLLKVQFDDAGNVTSCGGQASLVLGQTAKRKSPQGEWVDMSPQEINALFSTLKNPEIAKILDPDPEVLQVLAPFNVQYENETGRQIGMLAKDQSLCLIRVPGSVNRGSAICADVVERAGGSDVSQLVAEAYRLSPLHGPADIGLANAGGVRLPLETDGMQDLVLTQGLAYAVQPFPNELYVVQLSGQQVIDTLEEAVANWKDNGNSDGSHPYTSGLRWHLDLTKPRGQRFANVQRKDHVTDQWHPIDLQAIYSVVMPDYMAQGFEGYKTAGSVCGSIDSARCMTAGGTFLDESFTQYIAAAQSAGRKISRPACSEYSHQAVTLSDGRQLMRCE